MPELPDVEGYCAAIMGWFGGQTLSAVRLQSPFVLRTVTPRLDEFVSRRLVDCHRLGKRTVLAFEPEGFIVVHLMVAGRWRRISSPSKLPPRISLLSLTFGDHSLVLTEAGSRKRAGLWCVGCRAELIDHDPGGVEPLEVDQDTFDTAILRRNRTLKRALTDPSVLSGIGNAYSDEILFSARLSPLKMSHALTEEERRRLWVACREVLGGWRDRLCEAFQAKFPGAGEVTAFRPEFATHGKFGKPCPACGHAIQRIRYAENETDYCAHCQNESRLLADRGLSRLLKSDWPRTLDEAELRLNRYPTSPDG